MPCLCWWSGSLLFDISSSWIRGDLPYPLLFGMATQKVELDKFQIRSIGADASELLAKAQVITCYSIHMH